MLRKRSSNLFGPSKLTKKKNRPQLVSTVSAPARTLTLRSPMSGSMTSLRELYQFDFGLQDSKYSDLAHAEPLFKDTFYLSSDEDASPTPAEFCSLPEWPFPQQPSINVSAPESVEPAESSDANSISEQELHDLTEEIYNATTITYTRAGKVNLVEIRSKRPTRETSRASSISTHDTVFSHNDQQSIPSTPASSIYARSYHSPTGSISPDIDNRPFCIPYKPDDRSSPDYVEKLPREMTLQSLPSRDATIKPKQKSGVYVSAAEISPWAGNERPSAPPSLRRSKKSLANIWSRR